MISSIFRCNGMRPLAMSMSCIRKITGPVQLRPVQLSLLRHRHDRTSVLVKATAASDSTPLSPHFQGLGVSTDLLTALQEKSLVQPTEIQTITIPSILRDRKSDFMIASHTGSGKTLAYLLPIVQILKEQEVVTGPPAKPKRPRALILGPTRELTDQIFQVAKYLSHSAKFRSAVVNGSGDLASQKASLNRPIDILVGTPGKVVQHASKSNVFYGDVEVVVLDEADTMMDRGFGPEVMEIIEAVKNKPTPARCILVSATMTKPVRKLLSEEFPSMRTIETSSLHKGVAGARHTFLPVPGDSDKLDVLVQVIEGEWKRGKRIMVFCNTLDSCRAVDHHLSDRQLPTACYHGDVPLEERRNAIRQFSEAEVDQDAPLLVCTDLAARGLDIPGKVDHIVNFDFPLNPVDYIHRTGRTARAGNTGRITSLVAKADKVLASRIEEALTKGLALDSLSADKAVLPLHMRPKPETYERRTIERKFGKGASSSRGGRGKKFGSSSSSGRNSSEGSSSSSSYGRRPSSGGSYSGGRGGSSSSYGGGGRGGSSSSGSGRRGGGRSSYQSK